MNEGECWCCGFPGLRHEHARWCWGYGSTTIDPAVTLRIPIPSINWKEQELVLLQNLLALSERLRVMP